MPRVLVVEDDESIAQVIRYHLESAGFEGSFSSTVDEAWRTTEAESPDIAIVDIKLPGESGWVFLERLRADPRYARLPAVVLTGMLEPEIVQKAHSMGADYLGKPFAASALMTKIKHLTSELAPPAGGARPAKPPGPLPEPPSRPVPAAAPVATLRPPIEQDSSHVVPLVAVGVVLLMDAYRIEGKVHLPPEIERFSEAWESVVGDQRSFLPVTDVRILTVDGQLISTTSFCAIAKGEVRGVFPLDVPLSS